MKLVNNIHKFVFPFQKLSIGSILPITMGIHNSLKLYCIDFDGQPATMENARFVIDDQNQDTFLAVACGWYCIAIYDDPTKTNLVKITSFTTSLTVNFACTITREEIINTRRFKLVDISSNGRVILVSDVDELFEYKDDAFEPLVVNNQPAGEILKVAVDGRNLYILVDGQSGIYYHEGMKKTFSLRFFVPVYQSFSLMDNREYTTRKI